MAFYRAFAHVEFCGNFFACFGFTYQTQDVYFGFRKRGSIREQVVLSVRVRGVAVHG